MAATPARKKKWIGWLLLAVGCGLLLLLILKIGPRDMLDAWRAANKPLLIVGFGTFTLGLLLRGAKWKFFLSATPHPVAYRPCLRAYVINAFLANLTPARSGELLAPIWLARRGVPTAAGYAVVVIDHMLDAVAVLSLFFLAVWNFNRIAPETLETYHFFGLTADLRSLGAAFGICVGIGLVVVILALLRLDLAIGRLRRLPGRAAQKIAAALQSFREALGILGNRRVLAINFLLTYACWALDLCTSYLVVRSFIPTLAFTDSATASMFAGVIALASFIPGGIGVGAAGYTVVIAIIGYADSLDAAAAGAVMMTILTHSTRAALSGLLAREKDQDLRLPDRH